MTKDIVLVTPAGIFITPKGETMFRFAGSPADFISILQQFPAFAVDAADIRVREADAPSPAWPTCAARTDGGICQPFAFTDDTCEFCGVAL